MEGALQRAHCGKLDLVQEKLRLAAALSAATSMLAGVRDTHVRRQKKEPADLISLHDDILCCLDLGMYGQLPLRFMEARQCR